MKILIIHQHFYPEPSGTAKSCTEMAVYFVSKYEKVTVITEFPNRSFKSYSDRYTNLKRREYYKGVTVYRIKNKFKYSSNKYSRVVAYLMFTILSFITAKKLREKFNLCITIQSLPAAIPGVLLNKIDCIPHHFYCTDMMPDLGIVSGLISNKMVIRLSRGLERFVYDHSEAVYAVSVSMAKSIRQKTINKRIYVLSDWIDAEYFNSNKNKYQEYLKSQYNLKQKKIILYIGNIGFLQDIGTFIETAKMMEKNGNYNNYQFVIGGTGVQKEKLEKRVKKYGLKNVDFIGVVDRKYVPSFLQLSSLLIMNFVDHPHMALYRSSKIFDYIAAEKPVVVGAIGELAEIVKKYKLGEVAQPSDPVDFYEKIINAINTRYQLDNSALIRKYSKSNVLSSFYRTIIKI